MTPVLEMMGKEIARFSPLVPLSIPRALIGAAAAATQVKAKVSRRELFMPWTMIR